MSQRTRSSPPGNFNPRSPHGERQLQRRAEIADVVVFQPTLPARGATIEYFALYLPHKISTHAPRTGSDTAYARQELEEMIFQPTLPARGATAAQCPSKSFLCYFNPRSPHGERPYRRGWRFPG